MIAFFGVIAIVMILASDSVVATFAKWVAAVFLLSVYEPLLTSRSATLGQRAMRVRVRHADSGEKISLASAYIRFLCKWLLGFISFFSIPLSSRRMGIHDIAATTVVLNRSSVQDYQRAARPAG